MRKTICLILAFLLTAAILTGCGGAPKQIEPTPNGGKPDSGETSSDGEFKAGDIITFGTYEQDNDSSNGAEPVEWLVLDVVDGKAALLISVYGLDAKQYNNGLDSITWENCLLRKWLNEDFYAAAFSEEEKSRILTTHLANDDNAKFGTAGGNDTEDKLYLLSYADVNKYFDSNEAKQCAPTAFAVANGVEESFYAKIGDKPTSVWWLRSPGSNSIYVSGVRENGNADEGGFAVTNTTIAVRPVMWIAIG